MHLHRMTLQAVGPFPGRHTIDFAALSASGLFLLEGPTGSGKSTVIDALVFALYGKVASADASEDRMRSDHAAPGDDTFVDLVFETGSGIYRVLRTPRYERPKQRGTGTTTQQATIKLWRLTSPDAPDDGDLLSTRLDEAGLELAHAIGLDREQFVQTVVLPQGEFASFLRAKPEDRRRVLERVFGTEVYERLEKRLAAMRAEAGRGLDAARGEVGRAVAGFVAAARCADDDAAALREAAAGAEVDVPALTAAVEAVAGAAAAEAVAAEAVAARAAERCAVTERARDAARTTVVAVERRDTLLAERARLAARGAEHADDARRLAVAGRARLAMPAVAGVAQAETAFGEATTAVARRRAAVLAGAHADLAALVPAEAEADVQLKALADERERCTGIRARLDHALELEATLPTLRVAVADLEARVERRAAERDALVDGLAQRPHERAALRERRDALGAAAGGLAEAQVALRAVEDRRAAAALVAELEPRVGTAEAAAGVAARAASEALEHAAALRQARIAGIAAELAVELAPGAPCPVCGGTEHPHPAAPSAEAVTPEVVHAAEEACAVADEVLAAAGRVLTELRTKRDGARASADGWDLPAADAAVADARRAVEEAQAAARDRDAVDAELEAFDAGTRALEQQRAELDTVVGKDGVALAGRRKEIRDAETAIEAARESSDTVRARAALLDARVELVGAWLTEAQRLVTAEERLAERRVELAAALSEHGFDDAAAVRAAALDEAALAALDRRIREHDSALDRVERGLADDAVRAVGDVTADAARASSAEAEATHAAADEAATRAAGEAARLRDRASSAEREAAEVSRAGRALVAAREAAGPVVRMANVVAASGGDNARQLSLGTYVLARRFEDVVAAANGRLAAMSSGRYELLRSEEKERGGARKLGLALKVVDHHTERERDPATLSGGETFYFALSLALGLADVVTAEAGGTDLGTLFVDEGFGSLDGDTLDVVLAELGRLRDAGRVVGVVSHVDAMKQSIAERIEVRRAADGRSTLTVRA
ncbi:AAA family ATPase [Actinotalea fermentans]|uniref:Nuclease SbcCD subunit C n=1 Tax=Actinotalea fermentans TaxID=43671 RepID=A0A511YZM0_9CELL|nr:AAA family ATPase [Actinotalea fermentans]GEN80566.1 nuclease SbcCD subunit C [Actinotalea fermentans]